MKVRDRMKRRVFTLDEEDDLALAVQMMAWASVHHLPVLRGREVVGVLSEHDLFVALSRDPSREVLQRAVGEVMTHPAQTAHPDDDFLEAVARMATERISCLPVVERGALIGILTVTDVVADRVRGAFEPSEVERMPVDSVMTLDPLTSTEDELLLDAVSRMGADRIRHLPVVDADRKLVGMLSDRDVRTTVGDLRRGTGGDGSERLRALTVGDVMSREVVAVSAREPLARAVDILVERRYGAVPVVDSAGRLVGIVSYVDALRRLTGREQSREQDREPTPAP